MVIPALQMLGVSKQYPGTLAVDNVTFEVCSGEVHALMGENGAGKSTLMKMLAGAFVDYTGTVRIGGKEARLHSPEAAKEHGIGMVYQELSLVRPVSIAENLLIGRIPTRGGVFVDRRALLSESRRLLSYVGLNLDPLRTVDEISLHEAQLVEIAKVLGTRPCILILDEPTSALSREEVRRLFRIIRDLRNRGLAIVYISHHLPEVFEIADRVTVMRDGRTVGTHDIHDVTPQSVVRMMVGQSLAESFPKRNAQVGKPVLRVNHLSRFGFFHDVSFEIFSGEILGVAGLAGAGRTELARSLCGLDPIHEGSVEVCGDKLLRNNFAAAVAKGLTYLTEDRKQDGLFLRLSVAQNILAALLPSRRTSWGRLTGNEASTAREYLEALHVATASPDTDVGTLSGGNQQKVLLGKWLATRPKVLILDEPSRGVDVKAKLKIHEAVTALAESGTAVLLISSDLPELAGLSDRIIVLRNGHLSGEMKKGRLSEEAILLAANGEEPISCD